MPQKILIGINNLTAVDGLAYGNHIQFFYRLGREFADKGIDFKLFNPRRMSIDRMRNNAAKIAMGDPDITHILFLDDDVLVEPGDFTKLLEADKDIIAGVTYIRGYPYHPMLFDFEDLDNHYCDDYAKKADPQGLVKVDAVGFSFCLIKTAVFKEMTPPFFVTGERFTEDVYFCKAAKVQKPDVSIYGHAQVQTAHILGSVLINTSLMEAQKKYDETLNPHYLKTEKQGEDHSLTYFEAIGAIEPKKSWNAETDEKILDILTKPESPNVEEDIGQDE